MRLRVRHHDRSRQPGMPKLNLGKIAEGLLGALAEFAQNDPKAKLERERQEKLTLVRRWSTSSEQEQLRESFDLIEESSTEAEHDKRTARADKMFKSLLTKAEFRSNEVNQRDREERQLFETGRLLKTTPDPEELVYSQNADLRGISKFDPLGWIPVPSRVPKLDSKTKQLRRDCTSSVSSRLKKIIGFAEELTPMVVPHFESHRGQTYLSGHVAVPAVLELDLPAAEEDINGMKRRRPARRGHFARLFSPRTRIPELRIDLKDTDRLPLALRRFLDEPDWPPTGFEGRDS